MKTHIFIGSTFYDLKYKQEDLANFIRIHDFEPLMFKDGGLAHIPGKESDKSRNETMKLADMVVLIIGGDYGSSEDTAEENGYVTGREFKYSIEDDVPVYVFIDRQVYAEYGVYDENSEKIDKDDDFIKFRAAKDVNVFRFINEIKDMSNLSISEFSRLEEIKDYLSSEWSVMFKTHLKSLRGSKQTNEMDTTISKFDQLIEEMAVTLEKAGNRLIAVKQEIEEAEAAMPQPVDAQEASELIANFIRIGGNELSPELNVEILIDELQNYYERNEDRISQEFLENGIPSTVIEEEFSEPLSNKGITVKNYIDNCFTSMSLLVNFKANGMGEAIKNKILSDRTLYDKIFNSYE